MLQIKVSGSGNFSQLKREIAGVDMSLNKLNQTYETQMNMHRKSGNETALRDTQRAWNQELEKSRRNMIALVRAQGDYQVSSMKVARATDVMADRIQKNKFSLGDMLGSKKELDQLYKRQVAFSQAVGMTYGHTDAGSQRVDAMVPQHIQILNKRIDETRQKMGFYGQVLKSVSTDTINWGKNTQWSGRQLMAGMTYPLAMAAAGTVKYAYDMDKALTQIVKVYGDTGSAFRETDESIRNSATQTAKFLARTYGQSFQDTLEIQSQLASTGVTGPELQKSTVAVSEARLLGELDIQDAMKATISLQEVWGEKNEDLTKTFAYMNTMENQTSLTMQDFVVGLPKVSGIMKTLNADVEDTGVLFTAMKTAGIDAKEGGNAIKSMVFKDLAPSSTAIKRFKNLTGESLEEIANGAGGDVLLTLKGIGDAIKDLNQIEKINVAKEVFGIHQGGKAIGLIEQVREAYQPGSTSQVAEAMRISQMDPEEHLEIASGELRKLTNSDWNKAKRGIESIKISIAELGEVVLGEAGPALESIGRFIQGLADGFNGMSKGKQNLIVFATLMTALAGPAIMLVGLFANLAGQVGRMSAAMLTAAGSGMKIMTEKQNASRLAMEKETQATRENVKAKLLLNQVALGNARVTRNMAPNGAIPNATSIAGVGVGPRPMPREMVNSPKAEAWRQTQSAANSIELASEKTQRNWGGIAANAAMASTVVGSFGTMSTHSMTLVNNLSNALMIAGLVGPALTSAFKSATVEGGKLNTMIAPRLDAFSKTDRGAKVTAWAGRAQTGIKGLTASLLASLPVIGAVALAAGGLFYLWHKRQKEAKAAQDALNNSVENYASVLGVALNEERKFEVGSKENRWASYKEMADNANAADPNLRKATEGVNEQVEGIDSRAAEEQFIRNFAIQRGMEARIKGASAEAAKEIARVAAASIKSEFSERVALTITSDVFVKIDNVRVGQIDTVRRRMQDILSNEEKFFEVSNDVDVFGINGDGLFSVNINDEALAMIEKSTQDSWNAFGELSGAEAQKAYQKMATDAYVGMNHAYSSLSSEQEAILRSNEGVVDGRSLAKFVDKIGGYGELQKYLEERGVALDESQKKTVGGNLTVLNETLKSYALKAGANDKDVRENWQQAFNFDRLVNIDGMKMRGVKRSAASDNEILVAQAAYTAELNRAKKAGNEYSIVKKRALRDQYQEMLGLQRGVEWNAKWTREIAKNTQAKNDNAKAGKKVNPYDTTTMKGGKLQGGLFQYDDAAPFTPDELTSKYKDVMTATQQDISSFAMQSLDEEMAGRMNALDKEADQASKRLDQRADQMSARYERRFANIDAKYDLREQWFDSNWDKKMDDFQASWATRMETFEKDAEKAKDALSARYDTQINKIDKAIKAEQDAENQRQKIFEKEKARIQQYAQLANMAIDINMAISSGNLDEAAKLSNDAQASIETFEMDDAGAISQSASDKVVEGLEKDKEVESKRKDSALKALEERQEGERKLLEEQQKNSQKWLEIQQERDRKSLALERQSAKDRLNVEKKAEEASLAKERWMSRLSYENKKKNEQKKADAAKKAFQEELDALNAFIPRSKQELDQHRAAVSKAYDKYGVKLKTKGDDWAFIVRDRLTAHMRVASTEMENKVAWDRMAKRIGSRMTKGVFDMDLSEFKDWVFGGGQMKKTKAAATAGSDAQSRDGSRPMVGGITRHSGGIIDGSRGQRTGYSGNRLAQSEIMVNALKGESILNRNATARLGKSGVDALNKGKIRDGSERAPQTGDGPGFGGLMGLMAAGFMKPVIEKTIQKKGQEQQTKDAVEAASLAAGGVTGRFDAFWKALAQQESGGNYSVVNSSSGALGKYQVMPANVGPWSRQVLGRTVSTSAFLSTPSLQDKIVRGILGGYYKKWGARGAAAAWYAGPGNHDLHNSTRPQPGGPSIKGYVDSIVKRMNGYLAASGPASAPGSAGGGNVWEGMGWQKMWPIVARKFPHAIKTSDYRPGSITSTGNRSYHGMGRALDIASRNGTDGMMWIFKWLRKMFGTKSKEIIHSPAGGQQIKNGKSMYYGEPVRGDHWDHVHWAMRNGGVVPGRGAGDRTPIMGEPGEFMLRKKAVDHLGIDTLKMLNSDRFINMPAPSLTASAASGQRSGLDSQNNFAYDITIDARGNENAGDIGNVVRRILTEEQRKHGVSRKVGAKV